MALDIFDKLMHTNKETQIECRYFHLLHLFHSHLIPTPTHSEESSSTIESVPNKKPNLSCNHTVESVLKKFKNILRFFPSSNKPQLPIINYNPSSLRIMKFPCATDLQLAGVKFKKNEKSKNILNVKFSHGVLEMTPFLIHGDSETLFRNLVAFEQCRRHVNFHFFTTFFVFMNFLVNTSKDVALLHRNGIIFHLLESDDEAANLFNRLCSGSAYSFEGSYLSALKDDVQKHCENKWNMWWAKLKRDYFTNPWSFISLIAASILLLLTITQTFFTVFPYLRPQS
ncbi:UPF0481 protein At3g47200-like [Magnolia sinica]|uniref:UPF0481 protein At3g47200-like n=1 Tax=Magnolia sinica TaxID=86752 RepID=UPI00265980C9|nr:UPF0481 protein At3g47200-like [Magnolia sinica]